MPPKRKRRSPPPPKGLAAGEKLKRNTLAGSDYSAWGWVGTEVTDASQITREHCLATCGFLDSASRPFCANKYVSKAEPEPATEDPSPESANGELGDDIIVISDDEEPPCSRKLCKDSPNCLNYLGQQKWEDEEEARVGFQEMSKLGRNPLLDSRDPDCPVGLRNLGATCYANAFLQVWFQDLAFRSGVYKCRPSQDAEDKFEESPIYQLQVTFAALQEGTQSVFNPIKLVESLQLRTSEQQDAQEFSKLFLSHLDSEFQKQSVPSLKTLVSDQFQGKQVYGTICKNCKGRSERESDFLEIEINLENNSKLEDRIATLLQNETLSGDNRYLCSRCEGLQDATRYTELRSLPPVLHFSLLRFVYDLSTMERKKSKQAILFPLILDMNRFLKQSGRHSIGDNSTVRKDLYKLRGVLLHKGPSAYHGHYEAQVFDIGTGSWHQFNDETVTKIKSLFPKPKVKKSDDQENSDGDKNSKRQRVAAKKKRRIDDSDVEEVEPPRSGSQNKETSCEDTSYVSSKDAYMLIYARQDEIPSERGSLGHTQTTSSTVVGGCSGLSVPSPPARAFEAVARLDASHDKACEDFAQRAKEVEARFQETRRQVMAIYRAWSRCPGDKAMSVVASRAALENWLSRFFVKRLETKSSIDATVPQSTPSNIKPSENGHQRGSSPSAGRSPGFDPVRHIIDNSSIICRHGKLDPQKAGEMKRICESGAEAMATFEDCTFSPMLKRIDDVCEDCVREIYIEKLYHVEHPKLVARFDEICEQGSDVGGYWISKLWVRDWRLTQPKMHVPFEGDPPPDSNGYKTHVTCEHDCLTLSTATRRKISRKAFQLLRGLFPSWEPPPVDTEPCAVCETLLHISKGDKLILRKQAEDEKAKLKHMHDNALTSRAALLHNVPCAVVPANFVRSWRKWLLRPTDVSKPSTIDNSPFICEHQMLVIDPNSPADLDVTVAVITRADWDILEDFYSAGPLIAIENRGPMDDGDTRHAIWHDLPVCQDCRLKRRSEFEETEVTVRVLHVNDPLPTPETFDQLGTMELHSSNRQPNCSKNGSNTGVRKSKRIRDARASHVQRRVLIRKETTVKEIKLMLQDALDIPTIAQRLFYRGHEIHDNSVTAASLDILTNDVLDLRHEGEDIALLDSDEDGEPLQKRQRRDEGRAFGGTLLGGAPKPKEPPAEELIKLVTTTSPPPKEDARTCIVCTFDNPPEVVVCTMCDTVF